MRTLYEMNQALFDAETRVSTALGGARAHSCYVGKSLSFRESFH
jgi:hypothetical protein